MEPQLNSNIPGNQGQFFGQKVSRLGINVNNAADNQLILKDDFSTRTYYDGNGVPRILIGLLPDGTYGIVVSLPNIDVTSVFS